MNDSGVTPDLYDEISSNFLLSVIAKHDHGAKMLCNKDPFTLRHIELLTEPKMFPNAKFILMLRDPRKSCIEIFSFSENLTSLTT